MSKFTVYYFPIKGLAEVPRLLLEYAGEPYTNQYPKDWATEKPLTEFGQLPVLIEKKPDGSEFHLAQSSAIVRYLAKKFGLTGKTAEEDALIDSLFDALVDLRTAFNKVKYAAAEQKEELKNTFYSSIWPSSAKLIDAYVKKHGKNGFSVGDKLTFVDFALFQVLFVVQEAKNGALDSYSNLHSTYKKIAGLASIANYLSSSRRHSE